MKGSSIPRQRACLVCFTGDLPPTRRAENFLHFTHFFLFVSVLLCAVLSCPVLFCCVLFCSVLCCSALLFSVMLCLFPILFSVLCCCCLVLFCFVLPTLSCPAFCSVLLISILFYNIVSHNLSIVGCRIPSEGLAGGRASARTAR